MLTKQQRKQLERLNAKHTIRAWATRLISVEGETCTVQVLGSSLILDGVRLYRATDEDTEPGTLLATPLPGSLVLIGTINNGEPLVLQITQTQSFTYEGQSFNLTFEDEVLTIKRPEQQPNFYSVHNL
ncbi:hypothetical protein DYU11_18385 [Fibrisoma montanum]|uniref:Uncharacterized protein n=1 Tax=Fibrisoma montanum TaxID=2305895 RepID=A0A418M6J0_9BACT|nr:hypothetical protein [Fibrisoma montanum]RIV21375.1 hypothetical protein DYU11_18385 [Fibrisoma montanum]